MNWFNFTWHIKATLQSFELVSQIKDELLKKLVSVNIQQNMHGGDGSIVTL